VIGVDAVRVGVPNVQNGSRRPTTRIDFAHLSNRSVENQSVVGMAVFANLHNHGRTCLLDGGVALVERTLNVGPSQSTFGSGRS
jgi:hypothetical protein